MTTDPGLTQKRNLSRVTGARERADTFSRAERTTVYERSLDPLCEFPVVFAASEVKAAFHSPKIVSFSLKGERENGN